MGKELWKPGNMLYPLPAVMVSLADQEGHPNIITLAWVGTVCTNPPMVSISVRPERYSYPILKETGEFVINLTTKEFDVLELLVLNPNKVYSRENLLKLVWGADYPGDVRTVDVHIRRLREKIEANPSEPKYVHTKWGIGYYYKN